MALAGLDKILVITGSQTFFKTGRNLHNIPDLIVVEIILQRFAVVGVKRYTVMDRTKIVAQCLTCHALILVDQADVDR